MKKVPRPVEVKLPPEPVVKKRFVELAVVAKRFVVVALEEVELPKTPEPKLKAVAKRFVDEA